jgi:putative addiction module component (TIGR02574 family)
MPIDPTIRSVFEYFQTLNLLVLINNLRAGAAIDGAWVTGPYLCPVAHGLAGAAVVDEMNYLNQSAPLPRACDHAARRLGADADSIYRFVIDWDRHRISPEWLQEQLEAIWRERLEDAVAVQEVLGEAGVEDAWEAELERRVVAIESGEVVGIPAEKLHAQLRKQYPRNR